MSLAGYLPPVVAEVVSEIGKYSAGMAEVKAEMGTLEAAQTKLAAVGKMAAVGLAAGVALVGYESVKMGMAFDQQMELIHTQAGASQAQVESLKRSVLDLAPAVGIGPEKLAQGLYHIESTGMRGAQALDVLKQAAKLAAIGLADLDDVTYAMSGVMAVGMKDVNGAADAISYMNATVGMGDMRMAQLTAAIGTGILPSFKSAGLGMKDFSAALATIADNSTPADEAATRLRMTVAMMAAPSGPAVDALKKIGLSATALATDLQQPNGLLVAVKDLKTHLEESGQSAVEQNATMEHAFGGGKTSGSILTLLEEVDRLQSKYDQLGTAESRAAATDEAWQQQQKQFSQQWHEFVATVQVAGVKIGEWLIPHLQDAVTWINSNTETVKVLAAVIGGVLLVAMAAWIVTLIEAAALNVAATWEIMLIVAAIAALAYGIYELVKHWNTAWTWIKDVASGVWAWLVGAWHATINALVEAAHWVKTRVIDPVAAWFKHYLVDPVRLYLTILLDVWKFMWGFASVIVDDFKVRWDATWQKIAAVAQWAWDNVLHPVIDFIITTGITPTLAAVGLLRQGWDLAWAGIHAAVSWAWENVIQPVMGLIQTYGVEPVKAGISELGRIWDLIWDGIKSTVGAAWAYLKPIFDLIGGGIAAIKSGIDQVANDPFGSGQRAAHILGFADGGVVPGPVGAPRLAVVHGGEQILSNDQLAGMGSRGTSGGFAAAGGGDQVVHQKIYLDSKVVWEGQLRYARRRGLAPAELYPASAGQF